MPFPGAQEEGAQLQVRLRSLLSQDCVKTRPFGQHLVVDVKSDDVWMPVARITRLGQGRYGVGFRNHSGRWEPVPESGTLDEVAEFVASAFRPYLDADN